MFLSPAGLPFLALIGFYFLALLLSLPRASLCLSSKLPLSPARGIRSWVKHSENREGRRKGNSRGAGNETGKSDGEDEERASGIRFWWMSRPTLDSQVSRTSLFSNGFNQHSHLLSRSPFLAGVRTHTGELGQSKGSSFFTTTVDVGQDENRQDNFHSWRFSGWGGGQRREGLSPHFSSGKSAVSLGRRTLLFVLPHLPGPARAALFESVRTPRGKEASSRLFCWFGRSSGPFHFPFSLSFPGFSLPSFVGLHRENASRVFPRKQDKEGPYPLGKKLLGFASTSSLVSMRNPFAPSSTLRRVCPSLHSCSLTSLQSASAPRPDFSQGAVVALPKSALPLEENRLPNIPSSFALPSAFSFFAGKTPPFASYSAYTHAATSGVRTHPPSSSLLLAHSLEHLTTPSSGPGPASLSSLDERETLTEWAEEGGESFVTELRRAASIMSQRREEQEFQTRQIQSELADLQRREEQRAREQSRCRREAELYQGLRPFTVEDLRKNKKLTLALDTLIARKRDEKRKASLLRIPMKQRFPLFLLRPGMEVYGKVRKVLPFGCRVDIGCLDTWALLHVRDMSRITDSKKAGNLFLSSASEGPPPSSTPSALTDREGSGAPPPTGLSPPPVSQGVLTKKEKKRQGSFTEEEQEALAKFWIQYPADVVREGQLLRLFIKHVDVSKRILSVTTQGRGPDFFRTSPSSCSAASSLSSPGLLKDEKTRRKVCGDLSPEEIEEKERSRREMARWDVGDFFVGQEVEGRVTRVTYLGLYVDIHGLTDAFIHFYELHGLRMRRLDNDNRQRLDSLRKKYDPVAYEVMCGAEKSIQEERRDTRSTHSAASGLGGRQRSRRGKGGGGGEPDEAEGGSSRLAALRAMFTEGSPESEEGEEEFVDEERRRVRERRREREIAENKWLYDVGDWVTDLRVSTIDAKRKRIQLSRRPARELIERWRKKERDEQRHALLTPQQREGLEEEEQAEESPALQELRRRAEEDLALKLYRQHKKKLLAFARERGLDPEEGKNTLPVFGQGRPPSDMAERCPEASSSNEEEEKKASVHAAESRLQRKKRLPEEDRTRKGQEERKKELNRRFASFGIGAFEEERDEEEIQEALDYLERWRVMNRNRRLQHQAYQEKKRQRRLERKAPDEMSIQEAWRVAGTVNEEVGMTDFVADAQRHARLSGVRTLQIPDFSGKYPKLKEVEPEDLGRLYPEFSLEKEDENQKMPRTGASSEGNSTDEDRGLKLPERRRDATGKRRLSKDGEEEDDREKEERLLDSRSREERIEKGKRPSILKTSDGEDSCIAVNEQTVGKEETEDLAPRKLQASCSSSASSSSIPPFSSPSFLSAGQTPRLAARYTLPSVSSTSSSSFLSPLTGGKDTEEARVDGSEEAFRRKRTRRESIGAQKQLLGRASPEEQKEEDLQEKHLSSLQRLPREKPLRSERNPAMRVIRELALATSSRAASSSSLAKAGPGPRGGEASSGVSLPSAETRTLKKKKNRKSGEDFEFTEEERQAVLRDLREHALAAAKKIQRTGEGEGKRGREEAWMTQVLLEAQEEEEEWKEKVAAGYRDETDEAMDEVLDVLGIEDLTEEVFEEARRRDMLRKLKADRTDLAGDVKKLLRALLAQRNRAEVQEFEEIAAGHQADASWAQQTQAAQRLLFEGSEAELDREIQQKLGKAEVLDDADRQIQMTLEKHATREKKKEYKRERKALREAQMLSSSFSSSSLLDGATKTRADVNRATTGVREKQEAEEKVEDLYRGKKPPEATEEGDEEEPRNALPSASQQRREDQERQGTDFLSKDSREEQESRLLRENKKEPGPRADVREDEILKLLLDLDGDEGRGFVGPEKEKQEEGQGEDRRETQDEEFDEDALLSEIEKELEELLAPQGDQEDQIPQRGSAGEGKTRSEDAQEEKGVRRVDEEEEGEASAKSAGSEKASREANSAEEAEPATGGQDLITSSPGSSSSSSSFLGSSSPCPRPTVSPSCCFSLSSHSAAQRAREAAASATVEGPLPPPGEREGGEQGEAEKEGRGEQEKTGVEEKRRGAARRKESSSASPSTGKECRTEEEDSQETAQGSRRESGEAERETGLRVKNLSSARNEDTEVAKNRKDKQRPEANRRRKGLFGGEILQSEVGDCKCREGEKKEGGSGADEAKDGKFWGAERSGARLPDSGALSGSLDSVCFSSVSSEAGCVPTTAAFSMGSRSPPDRSLSSRPALLAIDPKPAPSTISRTDRVIRDTILRAAGTSPKRQGEKGRGAKDKVAGTGDEIHRERLRGMVEGTGRRPVSAALEEENERVAEANEKAENEARMFTRRCGVLGLRLPQRPVRTLEELWRLQSMQETPEGRGGHVAHHHETSSEEDKDVSKKKKQKKKGQLQEGGQETDEGDDLPTSTPGRQNHISPHRILMEAARRVHERGVFDQLVGTVEGQDEAARRRTARVLRVAGIGRDDQQRNGSGEKP